MKTTLRRKVRVRIAEVVATVAVAEPRPEMLWLCRLARDRGAATPDELLSAMPGLRGRAQAENVLRAAQFDLELVDEQGRLTHAGELALNTERVLVPERGIYYIWTLNDPLVGPSIIHFERVDVKFAKLPPQAAVELDFPFPLNRPVRSLLDGDSTFELRALASESGTVRGRWVADERRLELELAWDWDFASGANHWELRGELPASVGDLFAREGQRLQITTTPVPSAGLDIQGVFESWLARRPEGFRWDRVKNAMALNFDDVEVEEARTFHKSLRFDRVSVPTGGSFENVTVHAIPIVPADDAQAQSWTDHLFAEGVTDYEIRSRSIARLRTQLRNTPLAQHRVFLPDEDSLLAKLADTDVRVWWRIQAPSDVSLESPSSTARAAADVGLGAAR